MALLYIIPETEARTFFNDFFEAALPTPYVRSAHPITHLSAHPSDTHRLQEYPTFTGPVFPP